MKFLKIIVPLWIILVLQGFVIHGIHPTNTLKLPEKTVRIGLLIQDQNFLAAKHAAELAIQKANETGGYNGTPFELTELSMEGPWGTGSKQAVNLIFDKEVVAILGSNDGRNAHLVEQVSAKTRVVFISVWSGDPTLAQAYVPWYFSCVPNNLQQADVLIKEICIRENLKKIAAVSDNGYDSKLALNSFLQRLRLSGQSDPKKYFYDNSEQNFNVIVDQITKADADAIIFFGQSSASRKIIEQLKHKQSKIPVFGTLSVSEYEVTEKAEMTSYDNAVLVSSGHWFNSSGLSFRQEFRRKYGYQAGPVAAYAYDGMNLIIKSIRNAGTDREDIQRYLKETSYDGITGSIRFDDKGNRIGETGLMRIKNGIPLKIK